MQCRGIENSDANEDSVITIVNMSDVEGMLYKVHQLP